jgi:hypothetical protein
MIRSRPAPASWAKVASKASKNGFETPLETYQKHSPVADDRKLDFLGARRKLASSETYLRATPGSQRHFSLVKVLLCAQSQTREGSQLGHAGVWARSAAFPGECRLRQLDQKGDLVTGSIGSMAMVQIKRLESEADKVRIMHLKYFDESLTKMWRTGGRKKKTADKVFALLARSSFGPRVFEDLQVTDHGESRFKSCVKYELGDGCRLVTIQTAKMIALCFVGDHDDCEHWLNRHSGLVITRSDGILEPAYRSDAGSAINPLTRDPTPSPRALVQNLPERLVETTLQCAAQSYLENFGS